MALRNTGEFVERKGAGPRGSQAPGPWQWSHLLWTGDRGATWQLEGPYPTRAEAEDQRFRLILGKSGPGFARRIIPWPGGPEVA